MHFPSSNAARLDYSARDNMELQQICTGPVASDATSVPLNFLDRSRQRGFQYKAAHHDTHQYSPSWVPSYSTVLRSIPSSPSRAPPNQCTRRLGGFASPANRLCSFLPESGFLLVTCKLCNGLWSFSYSLSTTTKATGMKLNRAVDTSMIRDSGSFWNFKFKTEGSLTVCIPYSSFDSGVLAGHIWPGLGLGLKLSPKAWPPFLHHLWSKIVEKTLQ